MDLSRQSASQETLFENHNPSIQNEGSGDPVQADLGESFVDRVLKPIPPHIGKSIKLTQGIVVTLRGPSTGPYRGKTEGFHRHGFTIEQKEWLDVNVGITVGNHLWEDGLGDWLFQGSRWGKVDTLFRSGELFLDFRFRDRRKAMMFKLAWYGNS